MSTYIEHFQQLINLFSGYENLDRNFGCDLLVTKEILKNLAHFHALPFAFKVIHPEIFEQQMKPHMENVNTESPWKTREESKSAIIEILKESVTCLMIIPKIKSFLEQNDTNKSKTSGQFHTICHNDMWIKNILVKFNKGNPEKVKFVGHLFHTFASPATDIILLFLTSVQTRILRNHLDELLHFYYQNCIQTLRDLKIPIGQLSYELFLREFSICTRQVIGKALFILLFVIYGKEIGNSSPIHIPILNTRDDIPLTAKEKVWWFVEESERRGWLNV